MHHTASELGEQLAGIAVAAVLLHGVLHRLLGQVVLELKGGNGQAVDEQGQVEGAPGLVAAVAQLAGDAEAVGGKALGGLDVAWRRRAVEEIERMPAVLEALAQQVDDAPPGDLALEPGQELEPRGALVVEVKGLGDLRLGGAQKVCQLREIHGVLAVIVVGITRDPPGAAKGRQTLPRTGTRQCWFSPIAGHGSDDQALKSPFAGISSHSWPPAFVHHR
jgi:hypothetical protein